MLKNKKIFYVVLIILLLFGGFWYEKTFREHFHEVERCPCGCSCAGKCMCPNCPFRKKYGISQLYHLQQNPNLPVDTNCPYFRRKWDPMFENFSSFPRNTLSCEKSCHTEPQGCDINPYTQHYEDPRWKNERFWRRQEWAPGLPGEPGWYPTAPL
jgi:hypothetical protein